MNSTPGPRAETPRLLLVGILLAGILFSAALAQTDNSPDSTSPATSTTPDVPLAVTPASPSLDSLDPELMVSMINKVEARWWKRKAVGAQGNMPGAGEAARDLLEMLRGAGISRVEPMAEACVFEGQRLAADGKEKEAQDAFKLAFHLDPGNARAIWLAAPVAAKEDPASGSLWERRLKAVGWRLTEFWSSIADASQAGGWLVFALGLTGIGLVSVLLLYYGRAIVFEITERLPQDMHPAWRRTLGWTLVLSPAALVFLGVWTFVVWGVALVIFVQVPERRALLAWLVVLALAVPAIQWLSGLARFGGSPAARVALAAARQSLRPDLLDELNQLAHEHPKEPLFQAMLARLISSRHPDRSLQLLRRAVSLAPGEGRFRILLGNVYFRQGKLEPAAVEYRAALDLNAGDSVALFNLARAKMGIFDFAAGDELVKKARDLARHQIEHFEKTIPAGEVADPDFGVREVARRVRALEKTHSPPLNWLNPITLAALAALVFSILLSVRRKGLRAQLCPRCGQGFWPVNPGIPVDYPLCPACDQVLSHREGLDPAARAGQITRIDRHLRRTSRERQVLHFLWPGMSWVHEGRTWSGLAMGTAWAFLVLGTLLPQRWVPLTTTTPLWPPGRPFLVAAVLFWLVAQLPPLRPRPLLERKPR